MHPLDMKKTNKIFRMIMTLIGVWLIVSSVVARFAYSKARTDVVHFYTAMSKSTFRDTALVQELMYDWTNGWKTKLNWCFPLGFYYKSKIEYVENGIVYFSTNYALPQASRFMDVELNELYGVEYEERSDDDVSKHCTDFIGETLYGDVWKLVASNLDT